MIKKTLAASIIAILIILFTIGYLRINRQFPRAEEQITAMNTHTEYFDDVYITVNSARFLSKEEGKKYQYNFVDEPYFEKRHMEVTIEIENKAALEKEVHLHNLNLETQNGFHTAAAFVEFEKEDSNEFLIHHLLPYEKRAIKLIFPVLLDSFPENGKQIGEEYFYLIYDFYPIRKILDLTIK